MRAGTQTRKSILLGLKNFFFAKRLRSVVSFELLHIVSPFEDLKSLFQNSYGE